MTLDLGACLQKSDGFVSRIVAGEAILVPLRGSVADLNNLYVLNGVAARIWDLLDGQRSLDQILNTVCDEYDVSRDIAQADLADFVGQMENIGGVELV